MATGAGSLSDVIFPEYKTFPDPLLLILPLLLFSPLLGTSLGGCVSASGVKGFDVGARIDARSVSLAEDFLEGKGLLCTLDVAIVL